MFIRRYSKEKGKSYVCTCFQHFLSGRMRKEKKLADNSTLLEKITMRILMKLSFSFGEKIKRQLTRQKLGWDKSQVF